MGCNPPTFWGAWRSTGLGSKTLSLFNFVKCNGYGMQYTGMDMVCVECLASEPLFMSVDAMIDNTIGINVSNDGLRISPHTCGPY